MTRGQERAGAVFSLVLGVLGVWFSRRVTTDVLFGVIALCAFVLFVAPGVLRWWGNRASRKRTAERRRRERDAPWSVFSRPCPSQFGMWEVGIHRVADDGSVIESRPPDKITAEEHQLDIEIAVSDAKMKAARWNESQEAM